ncbi:hypothetical protein [Serratia marcescens]|uniref:hypothetical protein n=1 Tax=Serratia marcescens TaxID=615 RepID=UPI0027E4406D|nr:hypothetical protein [Serratia marcescens]
MTFLAEDFAQTSKEGEANGLHGWDNAHTVYNDCVSIVVDHVESPFYWSGPGKDWRLQPGLFNVCLFNFTTSGGSGILGVLTQPRRE